MVKEKTKQCKTKGCNNIVLDGKCCEFCKRKTKEKNDKIKAGGSVFLLGSLLAIKNDALKQAPKIAEKFIKVALRK